MDPIARCPHCRSEHLIDNTVHVREEGQEDNSVVVSGDRLLYIRPDHTPWLKHPFFLRMTGTPVERDETWCHFTEMARAVIGVECETACMLDMDVVDVLVCSWFQYHRILAICKKHTRSRPLAVFFI
jgi:hypothetical protein